MTSDKILSIIESELFEDKIHKIIWDLRKKRLSAGDRKFKRSPFDYLYENNMLNSESIGHQLFQIFKKQSKLPSNIRNYIFSLSWGSFVEVSKEMALENILKNND